MLFWFLRERSFGHALVDALQLTDQGSSAADVELGEIGDALTIQSLGDGRLERFDCQPFDCFGERLDEASVAIPDERRVSGGQQQPGQAGVTETDVEDRFEHPGHRHRGPGTNRDEQGTAGRAEASAGGSLEERKSSSEQLVDVRVEMTAGGVIVPAHLGREHESGGYGKASASQAVEISGLGPNGRRAAASVSGRAEQHQAAIGWPGRVGAHQEATAARMWSRRPRTERNRESVASSMPRHTLSAT